MTLLGCVCFLRTGSLEPVELHIKVQQNTDQGGRLLTLGYRVLSTNYTVLQGWKKTSVFRIKSFLGFLGFRFIGF